jgi:hypothetical protein
MPGAMGISGIGPGSTPPTMSSYSGNALGLKCYPTQKDTREGWSAWHTLKSSVSFTGEFLANFNPKNMILT